MASDVAARVPPGREKARADFVEAERLEACRRCCKNCAYAVRPKGRWWRLILLQFPGLLACLNHPDGGGEMREVTCEGVCRNFRYRCRRPVRLEPPEPPSPGVRCIPLTKGKHALVDAEDYDRLMKHKWMAFCSGGNWYACRKTKTECILMHREIMNPPKDMVVDHIDGNGLNNCKCNLRICTQGQNNCNRPPWGGYSRFKSVSWDNTRKQWKSCPSYQGRSVFNGRYATELEAARASDYKSVQFNGEYAYLNFPAEWPKERIREVHEAAQAERKRHKATEDAETARTDSKREAGDGA